MTTIKRNLVPLLFFILCFLFGIITSYYYYYPSAYIYIYWIFCILQITSIILSKIYLEPISIKQGTALLLILLFYLCGWFLVPQSIRFGLFLLSAFCFLYVGVLILNSKERWPKVLFSMLFFVSALNIIPILFFITQKSKITRELISTLFISNKQEMKEYVDANISWLHILFIVIFILAVFRLFFFEKRDAQKKVTIGLIFLLIISFSSSLLSGPIGALSSEYFSYLYQKKKLKQMVADRKNGQWNKNLSIKEEIGHAKKIVIIIGESLNRSYMSLYGYKRNTNPNLLRLVSDSLSKGRLFVFDDIISPEVNTVSALQKVLTNMSNQNPIDFERSISLLDLFNKAGFETFWLSNQAPLGVHDTPISVIASSTNHVYFTVHHPYNGNGGAPLGSYYDGELLKPFRNLISKSTNEKKQIYFVHLMGNHVNYEDRYPEKFNIFKQKEPNSLNLYLNSILYNDWVINNIIKIGNENKVDVVCYFSDHGDEMGYGHSTGNYKKGMSLIPFIVYCSNAYIQKNPSLVNLLKKNKSTPGMTDNFFNDIQGITGIKSSVYDNKASFISDSYIQLKRRVVNNTILFDNEEEVSK